MQIFEMNIIHCFSFRFLTYHCLLYNQTSWCQADSPGPPMLLENQQHNLSTSSNHTSRPTTSNQTASQPSKAPTAAGNRDNLNTIPPSNQDNSNATPPNNQDTIPPNQDNSKTTPPSNLDNSKTTPPSNHNSKTIPPSNQDNSKTTPPSNQDNSKTTPPSQDNSKTTPPSSQDNSKTTPPSNQDNSKTTPPSNQVYLQSQKTDIMATNNHDNLQRSNQPTLQQSQANTATGIQDNYNKTSATSSPSHLHNQTSKARTNHAHIPTLNQTLSQQSNATITPGDQSDSSKTLPNNQAQLLNQEAVNQAYSKATNNHGDLQRSVQSDSQRLKENTIVESHSNEIHQTQPQSLQVTICGVLYNRGSRSKSWWASYYIAIWLYK